MGCRPHTALSLQHICQLYNATQYSMLIVPKAGSVWEMGAEVTPEAGIVVSPIIQPNTLSWVDRLGAGKALSEEGGREREGQ